jgi:hypothetical protein
MEQASPAILAMPTGQSSGLVQDKVQSQSIPARSMNKIRGTQSPDSFQSTGDSDLYFGRGGGDLFTIQFSATYLHSRDRFYGEDGADKFYVKQLGSGDLRDLKDNLIEPTLIDGGNGYDNVSYFFANRESIRVQDYATLIQLENIESTHYFAEQLKGKFEGTGQAEKIAVGSYGHSTVEAGGGQDRIFDVVVHSGDLRIDGGSGRDLIASVFTLGSTDCEVFGGAGRDAFFAQTRSPGNKPFLDIGDFEKGEDRFLIDLSGIRPASTLDIGDGDVSPAAFREHIDIDTKTGMIFLDGKPMAEIDPGTRLSADDFLFFM